MPISIDSWVTLSDDQVSTSVGDAAVILGMQDGVYYGLQAVGARLWEHLAVPRPVTELVALLVDEFAVERARCEADVLALLSDLEAHRLVRVVPAAARG